MSGHTRKQFRGGPLISSARQSIFLVNGWFAMN